MRRRGAGQAQERQGDVEAAQHVTSDADADHRNRRNRHPLSAVGTPSSPPAVVACRHATARRRGCCPCSPSTCRIMVPAASPAKKGRTDEGASVCAAKTGGRCAQVRPPEVLHSNKSGIVGYQAGFKEQALTCCKSRTSGSFRRSWPQAG
jgi:hypothetical protein